MRENDHGSKLILAIWGQIGSHDLDLQGHFGSKVTIIYPANNNLAIKEIVETREGGYEAKLNFCNFWSNWAMTLTYGIT